METIKLTLEEQQSIEFKLEVEGGDVEEVRFCLGDKKTLLCWVGEKKSEDIYIFNIDLSKIKIKEKSMLCFLEVFVNGRKFTPFYGQAIFENKINVKAKLAHTNVTNTTLNETKTTTEEKNIKNIETQKKPQAKPIVRLII